MRWFDVDQEPVIELRRQLYDDRQNVTTIAASVTDSAWWSQVPDDLPRLVLAEGLLMYLDPDGVGAVVTSALGPGGTLVADTVAPWVTWIAGCQPAMRAADTAFRSSTTDLAAAASSYTRRERSPSSTPPRPAPGESCRRRSGSSRWSPGAVTRWS